jgi:hypothetical protein
MIHADGQTNLPILHQFNYVVKTTHKMLTQHTSGWRNSYIWRISGIQIVVWVLGQLEQATLYRILPLWKVSLQFPSFCSILTMFLTFNSRNKNAPECHNISVFSMNSVPLTSSLIAAKYFSRMYGRKLTNVFLTSSRLPRNSQIKFELKYQKFRTNELQQKITKQRWNTCWRHSHKTNCC